MSGGFMSDMSYQGSLAGINPGQRDKNARVLAMVHTDVPCREDLLVDQKTVAVPITVLRNLSGGFAQAPYATAKPGQRPAPLKDGLQPRPDPRNPQK